MVESEKSESYYLPMAYRDKDSNWGVAVVRLDASYSLHLPIVRDFGTEQDEIKKKKLFAVAEKFALDLNTQPALMRLVQEMKDGGGVLDVSEVEATWNVEAQTWKKPSS